MDWRQHIQAQPDVLSGKPVIRGTRLAVDFILGLLAAGWSEEEVLVNYPALDHAALQAIFAFAAECLRDERVYPLAV